jgi:ribose transport system permease protein
VIIVLAVLLQQRLATGGFRFRRPPTGAPGGGAVLQGTPAGAVSGGTGTEGGPGGARPGANEDAPST